MTIQTKELRTKDKKQTNLIEDLNLPWSKIDRESPTRTQYRNRVQKGTESLTWGHSRPFTGQKRATNLPLRAAKGTIYKTKP